MRGRASSLRKLSVSSPPNRRSFTDYKGNKPKALQHHKDEYGNVFYTVSKRGEGRGAPSPQSRDARASFLISDLLLDLDAYEVAGVRPFDSKDEEDLTTQFKTTGRRGEVSESLRELVKMLNQNRWNSEKLVLHPTHPKRLTDGDIMSAALREPPNSAVTETISKTSDAFDDSVGAREAGEKYDIKVLNNVHTLPDRDASGRDSLRKTMASGTPIPKDELRQLMKFGDHALRQSDFMKEAYQANGIPQYAIQNDEQRIRWLLLRQHNSSFVAGKTGSPSVQDVASAIASVQERDGARTIASDNITSIRRIMFHALSSGTNFSTEGPQCESRDIVALHLQESIEAVLASIPQKRHLLYETLALANNLLFRQEVRGNKGLELVAFSLRLQAAAGLGNLQLMATYLDQGLNIETFNNGTGTLTTLSNGTVAMTNLGAILRLLGNVLSWRPIHQRRLDDRELLFRILTGCNKTGYAQGDSIRKLVLNEHIWRERGCTLPRQKRCLDKFLTYVSLLGRAGGLHMLWSEWRTARKLVNAVERETGSEQKAARSLVIDKFRFALRQQKIWAELSTVNGEQTLEDLAVADCNMIAQDGEVSASTDTRWATMTNEDLWNTMNLPFAQWIKELKPTRE